jgi:hypothetical protein
LSLKETSAGKAAARVIQRDRRGLVSMTTPIKLVGWFQLVAGLFGTTFVLLVYQSRPDEPSAAVVADIVLSCGLLSTTAGALLLLDRRGGWQLSVLTQALQIPAFSLAGFAYYMGLGVFLAVGGYVPTFAESGVELASHVQLGLGTESFIALGGSMERQYAAANVVALGALILLLRNRPQPSPPSTSRGSAGTASEASAA